MIRHAPIEIENAEAIEKVLRKFNNYKHLLYQLRFEEKVINEFKKFYKSKRTNYIMKQLVTYELAKWYYRKSSFNKSLKYTNDFLKFCNTDSKEKAGAIALKSLNLYELGKHKKAINLIKESYLRYPDPNFGLILANYSGDKDTKSIYINSTLNYYNLTNIELKKEFLVKRDLLQVKKCFENQLLNKRTVSIIIPVSGEIDPVQTIKSIQMQTWSKIEIVIIDFSCNNNILNKLEKLQNEDNRIRIFSVNEKISFPEAINKGLRFAKGAYVTTIFPGEWAHPERLELQATKLIENNNLYATISQECIYTDDFVFISLNSDQTFIHNNFNSLMFRREKVVNSLGFFNLVKYCSHYEYFNRICSYFGKEAVLILYNGPLNFKYVKKEHIDEYRLYNNFEQPIGAVRDYIECFNTYHSEKNKMNLPYNNNDKSPYIIPNILKVDYDEETVMKYDVILASDFRLPGGTTSSNLEEINCHKKNGIKTGLLQLHRFNANPRRKIDEKIRRVVDGDLVSFIHSGEKATCSTLILRYPPSVQEFQSMLPDIKTKEIKVIINQTPNRNYGPNGEKGEMIYSITNCDEIIRKYFGIEPVWYPISESVRESLYKHHKQEIEKINLSESNWYNIIDVNEWRRKIIKDISREKIVIGRHSRDQREKWPSNVNQLLQIYPNDEKIEVKILGGAQTPNDMLGQIPKNWTVYEFGEIDPKEFLKTLDIFVYFTHDDLVEAFGRVIIEAMASGIPVIVPHRFKNTFKDSVIYAKPEEVKEKIFELINNTDYYLKRVEKARDFVEKKFGHSMHIKRLNLRKESVL